MRSNGPITLSLPAFRGVTRRLIFIALGVFFSVAVLERVSIDLMSVVINFCMLRPGSALHGFVWEFAAYPFLSFGLINLLLALSMLWFFGSALEDERGSFWFGEYFFIATIGGGVLVSLLSYAAAGRIPGIDTGSQLFGMWPAVLALLLAYAHFHAEEPLRVYFIVPVKAKYVAAIYLLLYLAATLWEGDRFGALAAICVALSGYAYLLLAPRKGLRFAASEKWFGLRNSYYRGRRRRAAKKFAVYMKKQGKETNLDLGGRYIDPDEKRHDLNDRRWMN